YIIFGDESQPNPLADLISAVARDVVDVGIAWGPAAGYFASNSSTPLDVTPLEPPGDAGLRFDVAMGVRRDDDRFRRLLHAILTRRKSDIDSVLDRFHVVRVSMPSPATEQARRSP